jgi:hypothetical protein
VVKWWKRFSFWTKVKLALIPLSLGEVLAVHLTESNKLFYLIPPVVYFVIYIIDNFIKDENHDGIVDGLEDKE